MSPKKICRIKNSLKFYLRHIKLVVSNRVKLTLCKIYLSLKSYIYIFNNKFSSLKIVEQNRKIENPLG